MLMNISCSAVTSIAVHLEFDNNCVKNQVIAIGDLIDVEYNKNGCRKRFQGKVIKISCTGEDPKGWYIIVDGSGDFDSDQARFSPMSILDLEVIHKADSVHYIQTPKDMTGVPYLRVVKGRLQYSQDGINWYFISVDKRDVLIKDEEGTIPDGRPHCPNMGYGDQDPFKDCIKDEVV